MEQQTCKNCGILHDVPSGWPWGECCSQECAIVAAWEQPEDQTMGADVGGF